MVIKRHGIQRDASKQRTSLALLCEANLDKECTNRGGVTNERSRGVAGCDPLSDWAKVDIGGRF